MPWLRPPLKPPISLIWAVSRSPSCCSSCCRIMCWEGLKRSLQRISWAMAADPQDPPKRWVPDPTESSDHLSHYWARCLPKNARMKIWSQSPERISEMALGAAHTRGVDPGRKKLLAACALTGVGVLQAKCSNQSVPSQTSISSIKPKVGKFQLGRICFSKFSVLVLGLGTCGPIGTAAKALQLTIRPWQLSNSQQVVAIGMMHLVFLPHQCSALPQNQPPRCQSP